MLTRSYQQMHITNTVFKRIQAFPAWKLTNAIAGSVLYLDPIHNLSD